jgi:hypothetical protein
VRLVLRDGETPALAWPAAGPRLIVHRVEAVLEDEGRLREILLRAAQAA